MIAHDHEENRRKQDIEFFSKLMESQAKVRGKFLSEANSTVAVSTQEDSQKSHPSNKSEVKPIMNQLPPPLTNFHDHRFFICQLPTSDHILSQNGRKTLLSCHRDMRVV